MGLILLLVIGYIILYVYKLVLHCLIPINQGFVPRVDSFTVQRIKITMKRVTNYYFAGIRSPGGYERGPKVSDPPG